MFAVLFREEDIVLHEWIAMPTVDQSCRFCHMKNLLMKYLINYFCSLIKTHFHLFLEETSTNCYIKVNDSYSRWHQGLWRGSNNASMYYNVWWDNNFATTFQIWKLRLPLFVNQLISHQLLLFHWNLFNDSFKSLASLYLPQCTPALDMLLNITSKKTCWINQEVNE